MVSHRDYFLSNQRLQLFKFELGREDFKALKVKIDSTIAVGMQQLKNESAVAKTADFQVRRA